MQMSVAMQVMKNDVAIRLRLLDRTAGSPPAAKVFRPPRARVSVERVLHRQGYRDLGRVRPAIRRAAEHAARLSEELHDPQACYRRFEIGSCRADGRLELCGSTVLRCEAFPKYLGWCSDAVLFVITTGRRIDEKVAEYAESGAGLLEALLLETAGSLALDDSTRHLKHHIAAEVASSALRLGTRMGPGHSYRLKSGIRMWPLEGQETLFGAFDGHALPVELLPSWAMLPKISRSGLFGAGALSTQQRATNWHLAIHSTYSGEGEIL